MRWKTLLLGATAALALTSGAQAAVLLTLDSTTAEGANFRYTYSGHVTPNMGFATGDQLVIVDFAGYVAGSISAPLLNVTTSISNTLPAGLTLTGGATDNPTIPDLVFTYTGTDFQTTGGPFPPGFDFSGLTALSSIGTSVNGSFAGSAVTNNGANAGLAAAINGNVQVPGPASAVPEPASWAMLLTGFFGLGFMLRRRKASTPSSALIPA